jgi:hypothetical protein
MDWVPELHNNDSDELRARADGRFGVVDCFQWPQMYCKEFEYAVCVPRKETSSIDLQFAWYTPTPDDFVIQPGTAFAVGTLRSHIVDGIDNLLTIARKRVQAWQANRAGKQDIVTKMLSSFKHDVNLLCRHPLTYRDIIVFVAQAQRSFLDIIAFMDYVEVVQVRSSWQTWSADRVNPNWMGCFTYDSKICDTFLAAGVPVWLVRAEAYIAPNMNIIKPVLLTFPDHITKSMYCDARNIVKPFPLLYHGHGGFHRHFHTRRDYAGTSGVNPDSSSSSALPQNPATGKAPSQAQQNKKARKNAASQLMKTSTCVLDVVNTRTLHFFHRFKYYSNSAKSQQVGGSLLSRKP